MTATTEAPANAAEQNPLATKQDYRVKVWDHLKRNRLGTYPYPLFGRIPNYNGANEAAARLLDLDEFKAAKSVEVNPDKALERCRILTLEQGKELYVPLPKLKDGLLKKLSTTENNENQLKRIVSRWGIEHTGLPIGLSDEQAVHIDMFVLGSVAVSRKGHRIGKGRGYADLEYAILKEMKAIDDSTTIVTVVHDSQVFDEIQPELFGKHDIPVDYILTPTEVIKVDEKLPRSEGIFWNLLSERSLKAMDILGKLHEKHTSEGRETTLKPDDSESEEKERSPHRYNRTSARKRFPFNQRRRRPLPTEHRRSESDEEKKGDEKPQRRGRVYRRQRRFSKQNKSKSPAANNEKDKKLQMPRRYRFNIDFSLLVSNIAQNVRVRDLKTALTENGIKPYHITWRGVRGFCYLHYVKPRDNNNEVKEAEEKSEESKESKPEPKQHAVDDVIDILQKMKISPESEPNLSVKVWEPITRIETTDVTAV